jgi:S-adenosylmethionine decarboxylase
MTMGALWAVDGYECDAEALRSTERIGALFADLIADAGLHAVAPPRWHVFPGAGGVTGVVLLSESHVACHTYPEHGFATLDLHCCRPGAAWDFDRRLREHLGARRVVVRSVPRGDGLALAVRPAGRAP